MRNIFFLLLLAVTTPMFAQVHYNRFGYTLVNDTVVDHFFYRKTLNDTTIKGEKFTKVLISSFNKLGGPMVNTYEYESRTTKTYTLLDSQFNVVHEITLTPGQDAVGVLYGKKDTLNSGFNTGFSPYKTYYDYNVFSAQYANFYSVRDTGSVVYFSRLDYTLGAYIQIKNGEKYTTYIQRDNAIVQALQNKSAEEFKYKITRGDEIQIGLKDNIADILYRILSFKTPIYDVVYKRDTLEDGKNGMLFKHSVVNETRFSRDEDKYVKVVANDTAYAYGAEYDNYSSKTYLIRRKPVKARLEFTKNVKAALVYEYKEYESDSYYGRSYLTEERNMGDTLFMIEGVIYDTIAGTPFPVYIRYFFNSYGYSDFAMPMYYPIAPDNYAKKFKEYNSLDSRDNSIVAIKYLKLNGKEYGKKVEVDSTILSHPLVKDMIGGNYYSDIYGSADLAKMDSLRYVDSLYAAMAAIDSAATTYPNITTYAYYSAGQNYIAAINIKTASSYSFMVYCSTDTDVYLDFYASPNEETGKRTLPKKYKVVKAKAGWNTITVKGPKLKKYMNYEVALYTGTYGQFMDNDETRSLLYYENGVNYDLQRVYDYYDEY